MSSQRSHDVPPSSRTDSEWLKGSQSRKSASRRDTNADVRHSKFSGSGRHTHLSSSPRELRSSDYSSRGVSSFRVTPHVAAQPHIAQHSALTVHSGTSSDRNGTVLFYSSVQKRGGAFTSSDQETRRQLQFRERRHAASGDQRACLSVTEAAELLNASQDERKRVDVRKAVEHTAGSAQGRKRNRFEVSSSDEEEPGSGE